MGDNTMLLVMSVLMVVTGSLNTVFVKLADMQTAENSVHETEGSGVFFNHPFLQVQKHISTRYHRIHLNLRRHPCFSARCSVSSLSFFWSSPDVSTKIQTRKERSKKTKTSRILEKQTPQVPPDKTRLHLLTASTMWHVCHLTHVGCKKTSQFD